MIPQNVFFFNIEEVPLNLFWSTSQSISTSLYSTVHFFKNPKTKDQINLEIPERNR